MVQTDVNLLSCPNPIAPAQPLGGFRAVLLSNGQSGLKLFLGFLRAWAWGFQAKR